MFFNVHPHFRTRSNSALEESPPCPNKRRKEDKKEEKSVKEETGAALGKFDLTRQPLLQGLTSDYDLELFLEAQVC